MTVLTLYKWMHAEAVTRDNLSRYNRHDATPSPSQRRRLIATSIFFVSLSVFTNTEKERPTMK